MAKAVIEETQGQISPTVKDVKSINLRNGPHYHEVVGSTQILDENGSHKLVPIPSADPKDPLNLPQWRKIVIVAALAFFGALSLAAEIIIAALIPVFQLVYSNIDPKILDQVSGSILSASGTLNTNPVSLLTSVANGPSLAKVTLLSSLPLLMNGVSCYLLVPLSIAIGRRPVMLMCGILCFVGGFWAGASQSLESHLAARAIQGIGAGAVEALIPLIVQDIMFLDQRGKAMSAIWSAQGLIIVTLGICSPIMVVTVGWRFIYWLTSGLSVLAWLFLFFFTPETKWARSAEDLAGISLDHKISGEKSPHSDTQFYSPRTFQTDLSIVPPSYQWKEAAQSLLDTFRTFPSPIVLWSICVLATLKAMQVAIAQTVPDVLIAEDWAFRRLGLSVVPIVVATPIVWLYAGAGADAITRWSAQRQKGKREPEAHLITLILPLILGVIAPALYGYAGQTYMNHQWILVLVPIFFHTLAELSALSIISVYVVECYPQWAGPVLVNLGSFRGIVAFAISFRATVWTNELGFLTTYSIYSAVLGAFLLLLPVIYFYGKRIRRWTAGTV